MHTTRALTVALALAATACGGSSDATADQATESTTTGSESPTSPFTESTVESTAGGPEATEDAATSVASWDGPDPLPLVEARMDELAVPFGQPMSVDAVAGLYAIPTDFPYPAGTITGVSHLWDLDERSDGIDIEEARIIGIDGDPSEVALDAISDSLGDADRWSRASAQRQEDQAFNDLYTTDDDDGVSRRVVLRGQPEPEGGEAPVQIRVEANPTAIPEPAWLAGLPRVDGGQLVEIVEGRGVIDVIFVGPAGDGRVQARWSYPSDRVAELEALIDSGVLLDAGFTYADTPFNNATVRIDVELGAWEGQVVVSEYTTDGEVAGYHLTYSLGRP